MATVGAGLDDSSSHSRPRGAARAQLVSGGTTFRVLRRNLPELQMRIGRLARRAERLGTVPLALRECGDAGGECTLVVLEGEPPTLAGWTLAAVVDHRDGEARLRITSSAAPALDPRRFCEPRCDHCRLWRRRAATFVVWHAATGRVRQVGTGCLRDFLGGHDAQRLCRQGEYVLMARGGVAAPAAPPGVGGGLGPEAFAAPAAVGVRAHRWGDPGRRGEDRHTA